MITIRETGKRLAQAAKEFDRASRRLNRNGPRIVRETLLEGKDHLQRAIQGQSAPFKAETRRLSEKWMIYKRKHEYFLGNLSATGIYGEKAIIVKRQGDGYIFGASKARYPGHQITYAQLARYLEHSTQTMPAIPHWQPAVAWLKTEIRRRLDAEVGDALRLR